MDIVISFFRDTLDGPFYIVWVVVLVILIFACIGYLAEKGINKKHEREKYATVNGNDGDVNIIQDVVVTEPVQNEVAQASLSDNTVVSNDINTNNNGVNSSQVISASTNEVGVIPDVVATPGESVTNVVNTEEVKDIPVQEVSNVVIPSINQDGNNTI